MWRFCVIITRQLDRRLPGNRLNTPIPFSFHRCLLSALLAIAAIITSGCRELDSYLLEDEVRQQFPEEIIPVRYMQIRDPDLRPCDRFRAGETPAVRIQCIDTVDTLYLIEHETLKMAYKNQLDLKPNQIFYQPFPGILPGTYTAYLQRANKGPGPLDLKHSACKFTVLDK